MDNSILFTPENEILWNRVNSEREISMLNKKRNESRGNDLKIETGS
jgi:hypothetical protein